MAEALLNYLGRMGYSFEDEREVFSLDQMIEQFDISQVSLGGPVFDFDKLQWLNGEWMRSSAIDRFVGLDPNLGRESQLFRAGCPSGFTRARTFSDLFKTALPLFNGYPEIEADDFGDDKDAVVAQLQFLLWRLEEPGAWDKARVERDIKTWHSRWTLSFVPSCRHFSLRSVAARMRSV